MCRWNEKNATAGFSLFELIAAMFVLSAGVLGVLTVYDRGLDNTRAVTEYMIAETAVQNEVETLRAAPFASLVNGEYNTLRSTTPQLERLVNAHPTVVIHDAVDGVPDLKMVEVRLRWTGERGRTIDKGVTTMIADQGT